jgi:hypothetical protein
MALEKLRDDDRVVQDRVRSQAMIFLPRRRNSGSAQESVGRAGFAGFG